MSDIVRDSVFGQLVRLATGGKVFRYPDELDPSIREKYINIEKSGNLAAHGTLQPPTEADEKKAEAAPSTSSSSSASTASTASSPSTDPKEEVERETDAAPERVVSNVSTQISRLRSAESHPKSLRQIPSHTNSFLHQVNTTSRVSRINTASGRSVDPEKGRDIHLVDWYGPDDSEVRSSNHEIL